MAAMPGVEPKRPIQANFAPLGMLERARKLSLGKRRQKQHPAGVERANQAEGLIDGRLLCIGKLGPAVFVIWLYEW